MSIKRKYVIVAIAVGAIFFVVLALLPLGRGKDEKDRTKDLYSSFSPSPGGLKALLLLLKELGFRVQRLLEEPGGEGWDACHAVFALQFDRHLTDEEMQEVTDWVANGGTLVTSTLPVLTSPLSHQFQDLSSDVRDIFELPDLPLSCYFAEDVPGWEGCLGPTSPVLPEGMATLTSGLFGKGEVANVKNMRCLMQGCRSNQTGTEGEDGGEDPTNEVWGDRSSVCRYLLVHDHCEILASITQIGEGEVIIIRDPSLLINRNIGKTDNLLLALFILDRLAPVAAEERRDIVIGFDEHRTSEKDDRPSMWDLLGEGARPAFYQFLLAITVAAFGLSRRFAPPFDRPDEKVRMSFMQTHTLASLLQRASAFGLALRIIHRHTLKRKREGVLQLTPERKEILEKMEQIHLSSYYADSRGIENRRLLQQYLRLLRKLEK